MGASPLSQYVLTLRQRAQQRCDSLMESRFVITLNNGFVLFMFPCLRLQLSNVHVDSVFLSVSMLLSSGIRYQKVMKRMIRGTRKVLPSSTPPPGYREVIPSMFIISLSRFSFFPLVQLLFIMLLLISRAKKPKEMKKKKKNRNMEEHKEVALDEDVVEDLVLSSDEDESESDNPSAGDDDNGKPVPQQQSKRRRRPTNMSKKNAKSHAKRSMKRKRAN